MADKKLTQGMNVDRLDQLVKDLGVRIKLYRSTVCPNVKSLESLDHDVNCKICNNNMVDFAPVETLGLFQQQDFLELFKVQGTFNTDEVMVTFLSGYTLQQYTRVDLLDFKEDFFELVQRQFFGSTPVDVLKYRACEVTGVFVIRNGVLIEFHCGADFALDVNGSVKWLGAHRPLDQEIYSIYYKYHPVYRAIKGIHRDRFSQFNTRPGDIKAPKVTINGVTYIKMPETWILKRDYLVERYTKQGQPLAPNLFYNPNVGTVDVLASSLLASPTYVPADGTTPITVTVQLLDQNGIGVPGKVVSLSSSRGVSDTITAPSGLTNIDGRCTFAIRSAVAGTSILQATDVTDLLIITNTIAVSFI